MSAKAMGWVLETDLEPVSKVILLSYADFVTESHTSWVSTQTMLRRVRVSKSTILRRMTGLIEEGYLRESQDQSKVSAYWLDKPLGSRPIVYDMALDDATRLQWKADRKPGPRRSAAAAFGAIGGSHSAAIRQARAAATDELVKEGVKLQPTPFALNTDKDDTQVGGGVNLQPRGGGVAAVEPRGVAAVEPRGVAALQPNPFHEPSLDPSSSSIQLCCIEEPGVDILANVTPLFGDAPASPRNRAQARKRRPLAEGDPLFAEWYAAYPVHKARGEAERAWAKAIREGADPQRLITEAKRYRDDPQVTRGYGKYPATWLNKKCWLDEDGPSLQADRSPVRPGGYPRGGAADPLADQKYGAGSTVI